MPRLRKRDLTKLRSNEFGIFRAAEIAELLNIHETTVWRWVRAKKFPMPVRISEQVTGWLGRDLKDWLESKRVKEDAA
jgi:predicted DNA-binding transcriptional regulator AlpA